MKLDDLFDKAQRLEAPGSLKERVMNQVVKDAAPAGIPPLAGRLERFFLSWRVAVPLAAAAALVLAVQFAGRPAGEVKTARQAAQQQPAAESPSQANMGEFIYETLGPVYEFASGQAAAFDDEPDDISQFVSKQLKEIYWLNGDNNA